MHGLDTRGDVLIWGLWESQTDAIIGVRFGDSDADTYRKDPMDKLLDYKDKEQKDKWVSIAMNNRKKYPFILSVEGMLGKEALIVLKNLSRLMAA